MSDPQGDFWEKAFLAAIVGLGAQFNEAYLVEQALLIADEATKVYEERMIQPKEKP